MAAFMPTYDPATGTIRPIPMCVSPTELCPSCNADAATISFRLPNTHFAQQHTLLPASREEVFAHSLRVKAKDPALPAGFGPPLVRQQRSSHEESQIQKEVAHLKSMMEGLHLRESTAGQHLWRSPASHYDTSAEVSL